MTPRPHTFGPRQARFRFLRDFVARYWYKLIRCFSTTACPRCDNARKLIVPTGPQGQKRPADAIGNAIAVAKIATGEIQDTKMIKSGRTKSGHAGAAARAKKLSPEDRKRIAEKASAARWRK